MKTSKTFRRKNEKKFKLDYLKNDQGYINIAILRDEKTMSMRYQQSIVENGLKCARARLKVY